MRIKDLPYELQLLAKIEMDAQNVPYNPFLTLTMAFLWQESSQGADFWIKVRNGEITEAPMIELPIPTIIIKKL